MKFGNKDKKIADARNNLKKSDELKPKPVINLQQEAKAADALSNIDMIIRENVKTSVPIKIKDLKNIVESAEKNKIILLFIINEYF
jgi:hypothetical protein